MIPSSACQPWLADKPGPMPEKRRGPASATPRYGARPDNDRPSGRDSKILFGTGIRIALEEMLTGRDYARVEDILRALADSSSVPSRSPEPAHEGVSPTLPNSRLWGMDGTEARRGQSRKVGSASTTARANRRRGIERLVSVPDSDRRADPLNVGARLAAAVAHAGPGRGVRSPRPRWCGGVDYPCRWR